MDDLTFFNLTFLGSVAANGFAEQNHLLTLNGVRNCLVYRCRFIGFRGDGVYIGSGDLGGQFNQVYIDTFERIVLAGQDIRAVLDEQGGQLAQILEDANAPCWAPDAPSDGPCPVN